MVLRFIRIIAAAAIIGMALLARGPSVTLGYEEDVPVVGLEAPTEGVDAGGEGLTPNVGPTMIDLIAPDASAPSPLPQPEASAEPVPTEILTPEASAEPVPTEILTPEASAEPVPTEILTPEASAEPVPTEILTPEASAEPVPTEAATPTDLPSAGSVQPEGSPTPDSALPPLSEPDALNGAGAAPAGTTITALSPSLDDAELPMIVVPSVPESAAMTVPPTATVGAGAAPPITSVRPGAAIEYEEAATGGVADARSLHFPAFAEQPVSASLVASIAVTNRAPAVAVAVEFGRAGSGWAGAIVFNLWLRRQMRERRMSQRRLAVLSGVNHSTISRLLRQDRHPSLDTATKLAKALRKAGGEFDTADYFVRLPEETVFPARRVEMALRGDDLLDEKDVQRLMQSYLSARRRRIGTPLGRVAGDRNGVRTEAT